MPLGISDMKVMAPVLTKSPEDQQVIDQFQTVVSEITTDDVITLNGDVILDTDRITYVEGQFHITKQPNTTGRPIE
jgi:NDP-sugar pyrophosphorylase family protein